MCIRDRISAWGARELAERGYHFDVSVDWLPGTDVSAAIADLRHTERKRHLTSRSPFPAIPKRLWQRMIATAGVSEATTWSDLPKKQAATLVRELKAATFAVTGKSMNKAEFVTCGGVTRNEIDFRTMESKLVPGLYFAGEILDVDGVTGGFNFQNAWTNGFHAGADIASR